MVVIWARILVRAKLRIFATPMLADRRTYENRNSAHLQRPNMGVAKIINLARTIIRALPLPLPLPLGLGY